MGDVFVQKSQYDVTDALRYYLMGFSGKFYRGLIFVDFVDPIIFAGLIFAVFLQRKLIPGNIIPAKINHQVIADFRGKSQICLILNRADYYSG